MLEMFEKVEEKLREILKYDKTFLNVMNRNNVSLTVEFDGDEMVLTRVLYYRDGISVGVTRYELITVTKAENGELLTDTRMIFEGWEQFLEA